MVDYKEWMCMIYYEFFDVIIIGGGLVGFYLVFYSGLREMKIKLIEY